MSEIELRKAFYDQRQAVREFSVPASFLDRCELACCAQFTHSARLCSRATPAHHYNWAHAVAQLKTSSGKAPLGIEDLG
jgi:hypothetical protein